MGIVVVFLRHYDVMVSCARHVFLSSSLATASTSVGFYRQSKKFTCVVRFQNFWRKFYAIQRPDGRTMWTAHKARCDENETIRLHPLLSASIAMRALPGIYLPSVAPALSIHCSAAGSSQRRGGSHVKCKGVLPRSVMSASQRSFITKPSISGSANDICYMYICYMYIACRLRLCN